jgi:hemolysin activation/secretion protein
MAGLRGLGAYSTYSVSWTNGRLDLSGWSADQTADAMTAKSAGDFNKWMVQASHLLRMSADSALYVGVSAQLADSNLDSSEKFILGGPQGVRAFPAGEATGDEGWLLNLEWRQGLDRDWRLVGFIDHGSIVLHHAPWADWNAATPGLSNRYSLTGAGASLVWTPAQGAQVTMTLASRLGSNPGRDPGGRDADNRSSDTRIWLQGSVSF